jgi:hypothetical protein
MPVIVKPILLMRIGDVTRVRHRKHPGHRWVSKPDRAARKSALDGEARKYAAAENIAPQPKNPSNTGIAVVHETSHAQRLKIHQSVTRSASTTSGMKHCSVELSA